MENKIYDANDVIVAVTDSAGNVVFGGRASGRTLTLEIYKLFQYNYEIEVQQTHKDAIHISFADMERMYRDAEAMQSVLVKHWDVFKRAAEAFADTLLDKVHFNELFADFFGRKMTDELYKEIGESLISALGAYEQTLEPPDIIYHLSRYVAGVVGKEL